MNRWFRKPAVLLVALSLGGCAAGSNYVPPTTTWPTGYAGERPAQPGQPVTDLAAEPRWWLNFNDPVLTQLIDQALTVNQDVKLAEARVREARALRQVAAAGRLPTVDFSVNAKRALTSENTVPPGSTAAVRFFPPPGATTDMYQVGFDASWELDLFGRIGRQVEAAEANIGAAEADRHGAIVSVLAEIASNYVQLRGFQREVAIAQENLRAQQDSYEIARARHQGGFVTELDVGRAQAQVAVTASQLPILEASVQTAIHRISVLLDKQPGALAELLTAPTAIPQVGAAIRAGLPADLLRRRPDIRRAERQVAAAHANLGAATAELFPRISLTGVLGLQSVELSTLLKRGSLDWSLGAGIAQPIFEGGKLRANIAVQNAREEQALIQYQSTVLTALEDVENALATIASEEQAHKELATAVSVSATVVDLAKVRYESGLVDFLEILDAQRTLYANQNQLADAEVKLSVAQIALYKAMGGGWERPANEASTGQDSMHSR